ncbi:YebC/PmpR family DNA-binding transcriptional regulator [Denitrificimonas caeni]|uniref:Probable transcriptional regulatory protein O6P33_12655 n=1 Tax=Denitrificimonas caeni TaxID=521720 RepID=A0AAF0AJ77_9GAMM|nr:YebC/PmpR family DNA-binding transcriptional regulator [Denitrificimonas caeni]NLJ13168.1 YebC/PmpR family DNA-binding transcriptional regulator [Gammaproteobacteria bacterium]WBE25180.1 YebC/PmpR family DNA-binding transcriptional regulator [Denitrificimonas caeni]
MAGHSKWANIKHRKERQDNKRGKIFTKLIRELTVAAKQGGGVVADNPRLRLAVDKALGANMTRDTIDRAIARGVGSNDGDNVEELVYEGYAPNGVAVFVEAMTDNRNRTAAEIRHAFNKYGGNLGTDGSVAYLFERKGQILYAPGVDEEALMDAALEAGAEDIETQDDGSVEVLTTFADFISVSEALTAAGFAAEQAEVTMIPTMTTELDLDGAEKVMRLIDVLEDLDDVQNVYSNAEISDEIMEQL